jgi:FKBP-type peptidyl-prolyl cis-trans isomerase
MKRSIINSFLVRCVATVFVAVGLTACLGDDPFEKQRKEDENKIKTYVSAKNLQGFFTTSGLYVDTVSVITPPGLTPRVQASSIVEISYKLYDLTRPNEVFLTESKSYTFQPQTGSFFAGLNEGILLLRRNQRAIFVIPSLLALGTSSVNVGGVAVPGGSPLRMEVTVLDVRTASEQEFVERTAINNHITAANYGATATRKEFEGVTIIVTTENLTGEQIKLNDNVTVGYVGRRLDNSQFDSNAATPFLLNAQANLIKGFVSGLQGFRVGEKGFIYIPSTLAYGATGSPGKIPPYAPIIFEIQSIKK